MEAFSFDYPHWYLLLCLVLGIFISALLYYKEQRFSSLNRWYVLLLAFFRFALVSFLAVLLLSPLLNLIREETKNPVIVILEDRTESITAATPEQVINMYNTGLESLLQELEKNNQVDRYNFGDEILPFTDSIGYEYKVSNISQALEYVYDMYNDQNLGAIVLASDGLYNEGRNPLYQNLNFKVPLFTIGLGDTIRKKDLLIKNIFYNKIAYLGDKITLQADVQAFNADAERSVLKIYEETNNTLQKLQDIRLNISGDDYFETKSIQLNTNTPGIIRYRLALDQLNNEKTIGNNFQDVYIEVLDAKQRILILANAPHPDLAALKEILESNKNYEITIEFANNSTIDILNFDFFIFHNLPSNTYDISSIVSRINNRRAPRLYIVGTQTNLQRFNRIQNTLNVSATNANSNEVQATLNPGFNLFNLNEKTINKIGQFVPVLSPFGEFTPGAKSNVLLYQKIGSIDTKYPLLCFSEDLGIKTSILAGEGIWKWKLYDFLEHQNFDIIKDLIGKTTVYTTVKEDKRKFRVSTLKNLYKENENVFFEAQLYNNSYQLISGPDVSLTLKNAAGEEFNYTFSKRNNSYYLNAGLFPEGSYRFTAETVYEGTKLEQTGRFTVQSIQLELFNLTADHQMLNNLSSKYGERVYQVSEMDQLVQKMVNSDNLKPVVYSSSSTRSVIHYKWIFALLFSFLALEWFIRRYLGSY